MPRNVTRRAIVAKAIQARRPAAASGGTMAPQGRGNVGPARPARAGFGIGPGRPTANPKTGIGQARSLRPKQSGTPGGGPALPPERAPTPWNSKYEQTVAGARKSYLNAEGNYDLAEQTAKQDFGLDPGFNDYQSNPNSRAALLEQTYLNHNRGIMNSAGLQLYSGSTSNRLGSNRLAYGTNRDELAKTYRDALGEIGAGRTKAAEEKAEAEQQAEWDRIGAAEKSEPDPEAAPAATKGEGKSKGKGPASKRRAATRTAVARAIPAPAPRRRRR